MGNSRQYRPLVTLAALYGAGGPIVGPRIAERLGVPFLDRGIPLAVASLCGLPANAIAEVDDEPSRGSRIAARLGRLSTVTGGSGGSFERLDQQERTVRGHIEEFLARSRETGAVVLGRGSMVVLRSAPGALHVSLRGPRTARVRQAAAMSGIDEDTAAERQKAEDHARRDYVRRVYGVDGDDPSHYHLMLDSTVLSFDVCVHLVVEAANARLEAANSEDA